MNAGGSKTTNMSSLSYSDCFPDLLCSEDSGEVLSASTGDSPEFSLDFDIVAEESIAAFIDDDRSSPAGVSHSLSSPGDSPELLSAFESPARIVEEESVTGFIGYEESFSPAGGSQFLSSSLDSSSRYRFVAWILKVRAFYSFHLVTAYLAVNYLDRFLNSHHLPQKMSGWPLQLLSVACLSLAAKMEEPLVPSLFNLQVEGAKFIFEPKTIQKMELLVLRVLDWRLRSVTPFTFISFFAHKLDITGTFTGFLIARSTDIILSNIHETSLLEHCPSSIAAAAILCAASEMPNLSLVTPKQAESWCDRLSKEKISNCYKVMQQNVVEHKRRKSIKVIPQFRITAQITKIRSSNDQSSSSSISFPSPYDNKRRKLNDHSWVVDDLA